MDKTRAQHSQNLYHQVTIGQKIIAGNLWLAPVAGYSDFAFRSLCVEQGASLTCTELVSSEALVRGSAKTALLLKRADTEKHWAVQLFGSSAAVMAQAALALAPFKPDSVDINAGCPVPKVVKTGAGAALMRTPLLLGQIVASVVQASEAALGAVPVTVKLRSGWDESSINYAECAHAAGDSGAALVSLHPRTRAQGYAGTSCWQHIADLVSRISIPVAGSGDLFSPPEAERMLCQTGCAALLFARGALGNPFIFSATKALLLAQSSSPPTPEIICAAGVRHLCLLAESYGERAACCMMRKHFCAYSKGLAGGSALRQRLVRASSIQEYRTILMVSD
ncbi:MAG: tRNA dihydrouridine synthase DusB [Spirochaetaceae bacterium]|jgi:nifR3 family TIM-barrel protein|nr:tRNA dihydrouridine synthase DusB [Spirochaetaceae bacterium]